jgi:hypothetical protein
MHKTFLKELATRALLVPKKIFTKGLGWLVSRLYFYLVSPGLLRSAAAYIYEQYGSNKNSQIEKTLYCVLDLEYCSVTFDTVSRLAACDLHRHRLGYTHIHPIIVPGKLDGVREEMPEYQSVVSVSERIWRIENMIVPIFHLLPSCKSYTKLENRSDIKHFLKDKASVLPSIYSLTFPCALSNNVTQNLKKTSQTVADCFRARAEEIQQIKKYINNTSGKRKTIIISLRQYDYMKERNSNLESWIAFASYLQKNNYSPIFVPDIDLAKKGIPEKMKQFPICLEASYKIETRMALYQEAWLNMAIAHGPMELCWYNKKCKYALFVKPSSSPQMQARALKRNGLVLNEQPIFAAAYQKWVWGKDDLNIIKKVFHEMEKELLT